MKKRLDQSGEDSPPFDAGAEEADLRLLDDRPDTAVDLASTKRDSLLRKRIQKLRGQETLSAEEEKHVRDMQAELRESDGNAALDRLLRQAEAPLKSFLFKKFGKDINVDEVFQEACVNAMLGIAGFREDSRFDTWFTKIAINAAISFQRKKRGRRETSFAAMEHLSPGSANEEATQGPADPNVMANPAMHPEQDEALARIHEALSVLSDDHRIALELLLLRYDYESIGVIEGISPGTVRSRLHRARNCLAEILRQKTTPGGATATASDLLVLDTILRSAEQKIRSSSSAADSKEPRLALLAHPGGNGFVHPKNIPEPVARDVEDGRPLPMSRRMRTVHEALWRLSDELRIPLDLWMQGMDIDVIAELEDVPAATVMERIRAGRKRLLPMLRRNGVLSEAIRGLPKKAASEQLSS